MARYVTGTIAQLSGKVAFNGHILDQPALSTLTRLLEGTAFRRVGVVRREGYRGRPAIIWEMDTEQTAFMTVVNKKGGLVTANRPSKKLKAA